MDVDAVLGFLKFNGWGLQLVMVLDEETGELTVIGEEPPKPPSGRSKVGLKKLDDLPPDPEP